VIFHQTSVKRRPKVDFEQYHSHIWSASLFLPVITGHHTNNPYKNPMKFCLSGCPVKAPQGGGGYYQ
jgi:hypothetical protein